MKFGKHVLKSYQPKKPSACFDRSSNRGGSEDCDQDSSVFKVDGALHRPSFHQVFDIAADGMCIIDNDFNVVEISRLLQSRIHQPINYDCPHKCYELIGGSECHTPQCPLSAIQKNNEPVELEVVRKFGKGDIYILSAIPLQSSDGNVIGIIEHFKDITEMKGVQQLLQGKVEELETEKRKVEQKNTALNELLDRLDSGKKKVANQVRVNLDHMVFPILETLREHIDPAKKNLISVLASCLQDITEPYVTLLRHENSSLSAAELEICSMIREGFTTKQIASLRGVSTATVIDQRRTVRKKLGIAKTDTNLTTYLRSLQQRASD